MPNFYLSDVSPKDRPWDDHRLAADHVACLYQEGDYLRLAIRMESCSGLLTFREVDGSLKLSSARFCRVRHCPVCQWRRSLSWKARIYQALPAIEEAYPKHRWLFLTYTLRNCLVKELRETVKLFNESHHRLVKLKRYPGIEYFRSLEVTRDRTDKGFAHPHVHSLVLVPPRYFKDKCYVRQDEWIDLWQRAARVDYRPSVHVKAVKDLSDAVKETFKYSVKPSDMVADLDWLIAITQQLHKTRSIAISKGLSKWLSESEPTDEELIHGDEQTVPIKDTDPTFLATWAKWEGRYRVSFLE